MENLTSVVTGRVLVTPLSAPPPDEQCCSLAQYLAKETLGAVMLLSCLLPLAGWQPLTLSDSGVLLPRREGQREPRAAARFRVCLIAAAVVAGL